jgi:hypothetical protein
MPEKLEKRLDEWSKIGMTPEDSRLHAKAPAGLATAKTSASVL